MLNVRVARRYAEALISFAVEEKILDRVAQDLLLLERTAGESKEFAVFLRSPVISKEKKKEALRALFEKNVHPVTFRFLELLVEKGRENTLPQVVREFYLMRDERLGVAEVQVAAATDLAKDQTEFMQKRFEELTKKNVRISFTLDKRLRGGFIARIGDTVFDGSIKRQLELLRDQFMDHH